jgi:hypothetical protein
MRHVKNHGDDDFKTSNFVITDRKELLERKMDEAQDQQERTHLKAI